MNWLSAITAFSKLFNALRGFYRGWRLRRGQGLKKRAWPPSRPDRFGPSGWRKSLPIWTLLVTMNWIAACDSINAPVAGCEWIRPKTVAEADRQTTETKRALPAQNLLVDEFCT